MSTSQDSLFVKPTGEASVIVTVVIILTILSTVVVLLRIYVRVTIRLFGADDWLMAIGWIFVVMHNSFLLWGAFSGLGLPDDMITHAQSVEAEKAVFAWGLTNAVAITFVKASICMALLRIAEQKVYRIILWTMIVLTALVDAAVVVISILACETISDNWDPSPGSECIHPSANLGVFLYPQFTIYVAADLACVVLPICILWNLRMNKRVKISTAIILGLGFFATIATVIRVPLTMDFNAEKDRLLYRGKLAPWSAAELNIGVITGSIPMLQKLVGWGTSDEVSAPSENTTASTKSDNMFELVSLRQMLGQGGSARRRDADEEESLGGATIHDREARPNTGQADNDSTTRMIKPVAPQDSVTDIERVTSSPTINDR